MRPARLASPSYQTTLPVPEVSESVRKQLMPVLEAVKFESATRLRFGDLDPIDLPQISETKGPHGVALQQTAAGQARQSAAPKHPLTDLLWPLIYNLAFARSFDGQASALLERLRAVQTPLEADSDFVARLSAANRTRSRWDPMWRVYQSGENGSLHVEKRGTYRLILPGQYASTQSLGRVPGPGEFVDMQVLKESTNVQPGFYFAFSETVPSEFDEAHLARIYFNIEADSVPWLLEKITSLLNRYRVPFRFKCLAHPSFYARFDPVVLYIAKRFLQMTLNILSDFRSELERRLRSGTPLLAKRLLEGMAGADEPGNGLSFGQSRSQLLGEGIVNAWLLGDQSALGRLAQVRFSFELQGLSLSEPHLAEGARDLYNWPAEEVR